MYSMYDIERNDGMLSGNEREWDEVGWGVRGCGEEWGGFHAERTCEVV
jgi:hypothetical protein